MKKNAQTTFEGQFDDENVELVFRKHIIAMRKQILFWSLITAVSLLPWAVLNPYNFNLLYIGLAGFFIGFLVFMYGWISWYFSVYVVTDQRLIQIKQKGFFDRRIIEVGLDKIQNVNHEVVGAQATLLGFGTIVIQTFVGDLIIDKVGHPENIHRQISQIIKREVSASPIGE